MVSSIRNVLQIHTRYRQAGGEDRAVEAERALLEAAGINVRQLIFDNDDLAEGISLARDMALAVSAIWSRAAVRRVGAAIDALRPDIVHVHNTFAAGSPAVFRAASAARVPVVNTLHNYRMVCPAATLFRDGLPCRDCVEALLPVPGVVHRCVRGSRAQSLVAATSLTVHRIVGTYSHAVDSYVALTTFQAQVLADGGLPRDRVHVVPNFLEPDPGTGGLAREGIIFVGRLAPEKGVPTLLRAAAIEPGRFTLVGDGPLRPDVERAAASGLLRYLGPMSAADAVGAMKRSAALVVPSTWYEGFPMVVIEAYATGTPVIASRIGSLEEVVDDGGTGRLVPAGEPSALAAAVRAVSDDPGTYARMGVAARRRYEEQHRGTSHLLALTDVYMAAVEARQARSIARTPA